MPTHEALSTALVEAHVEATAAATASGSKPIPPPRKRKGRASLARLHAGHDVLDRCARMVRARACCYCRVRGGGGCQVHALGSSDSRRVPCGCCYVCVCVVCQVGRVWRKHAAAKAARVRAGIAAKLAMFKDREAEAEVEKMMATKARGPPPRARTQPPQVATSEPHPHHTVVA